MAAFDAITEAPPPSRHWDDDDISPFQPVCQPVSVNWGRLGKERLKDGIVRADVLLVAASKASMQLISNLNSATQLLGTVTAPQLQPTGPGEDPTEKILDNTTDVLYLEEQFGNVLLLGVGSHLPAERCLEWAQSVLTCITPRRIIILASLSAGDLDEGTLYVLRTDADKKGDLELDAELAYLPPGTLVDNLPAALLSYAQVRHMPGMIIGHVQRGPSLDAQDLSLAATAMSVACHSYINTIPLVIQALECAKNQVGKKLDESSHLYI